MAKKRDISSRGWRSPSRYPTRGAPEVSRESVGMQKRREVEKKAAGRDTRSGLQCGKRRRTEVRRRRPDELSLVCANKPKWTANKYASTSKSERPYAWSWSVHVRRGVTKRVREEGEGRVAQCEGAEYVGDLGTFNGARLAATSRKGIRYFPLFTASFLPFSPTTRFPSFFFSKRHPPTTGVASKGHR